jgi:hypothetical protein
MLPGGQVVVWRDHVRVADGIRTEDVIDVPRSIAVPDDRDRVELIERLTTSSSANGERTLYHYKPIAGDRAGTPKILEAGTATIEQAFYFSNPRNFTDRTDCSLDWDLDLTTEEADAFYRSWVGRHLQGDALEREVARCHAANAIRDPRFEQIYRPRIEGAVDNARVLCLTRHPDNQFMWRDYADQHTGVCVEFGLPSIGDEPLAALPIIYSAMRRVKLSGDPLAMAKAVYFNKLKRFEIEQEYRIVHLDGPGESDSGYRRVDALRGIIFGAHIDPKHKAHLLRLVREFRPGIRVRQASIAPDDSILVSRFAG